MLRWVFAVLAMRGGHTHYWPTLYDAFIDPLCLLTTMSTLFVTVLFTDTIYNDTPDFTAHCLHLTGFYSHWGRYSRIKFFVLKCSFLIPVHEPIVILVSAHQLMTRNVTRKLKSLSNKIIPMIWPAVYNALKLWSLFGFYVNRTKRHIIQIHIIAWLIALSRWRHQMVVNLWLTSSEPRPVFQCSFKNIPPHIVAVYKIRICKQIMQRDKSGFISFSLL